MDGKGELFMFSLFVFSLSVSYLFRCCALAEDNKEEDNEVGEVEYDS